MIPLGTCTALVASASPAYSERCLERDGIFCRLLGVGGGCLAPRLVVDKMIRDGEWTGTLDAHELAEL